MDEGIKQMLMDWAAEFNDPVYFLEDPISFPRHFAERGAGLQDVEIAAVFASHLAWGRRSMIVRDCTRLFDEMEWRPFATFVLSSIQRALSIRDCSPSRPPTGIS